MSKIIVAFFGCLFLISSCKCSCNNTKESGIANTDTSMTTAMAEGKTDSNANASTNSNVGVLNASNDANTETNLFKKDHHNKSKYAGKTPGEFPEASDRILNEKDVEYLSQWGLKVMLNEIYARHGKIFPEDPQLETHYKRAGWYHGYNPNVSKALTKIEKENIVFLKNYKFKPGVE